MIKINFNTTDFYPNFTRNFEIIKYICDIYFLSGLQDRRQTSGPGSSQHQHGQHNHQHGHQAERRTTLPNNHGAERRHMGPMSLSLSDRRHISPPLHINICETAPSLHTLSPVSGQPDAMAMNHARSNMNMDYSQRRNGRGGMSLNLYIFVSRNSYNLQICCTRTFFLMLTIDILRRIILRP